MNSPKETCRLGSLCKQQDDKSHTERYFHPKCGSDIFDVKTKKKIREEKIQSPYFDDSVHINRFRDRILERMEKKIPEHLTRRMTAEQNLTRSNNKIQRKNDIRNIRKKTTKPPEKESLYTKVGKFNQDCVSLMVFNMSSSESYSWELRLKHFSRFIQKEKTDIICIQYIEIFNDILKLLRCLNYNYSAISYVDSQKKFYQAVFFLPQKVHLISYNEFKKYNSNCLVFKELHSKKYLHVYNSNLALCDQMKILKYGSCLINSSLDRRGGVIICGEISKKGSALYQQFQLSKMKNSFDYEGLNKFGENCVSSIWFNETMKLMGSSYSNVDVVLPNDYFPFICTPILSSFRLK